MIVPVMAISNLVLTRQIYSEETNGAHAHNRDRVPLNRCFYSVTSDKGVLLNRVTQYLTSNSVNRVTRKRVTG